MMYFWYKHIPLFKNIIHYTTGLHRSHLYFMCKYYSCSKKKLQGSFNACSDTQKSGANQCIVATDIHVRPLLSARSTKHTIQRSGN